MPNNDRLSGLRRSMSEFRTDSSSITSGSNPLPAQNSVASPEVIAQQLCSFHADVLILRTEIRTMKDEMIAKQSTVIDALSRLVEIGEQNQTIMLESGETMRALGYQGAILVNKGEEVLQQTKNVETIVKRRVEQVDSGGVDAE